MLTALWRAVRAHELRGDVGDVPDQKPLVPEFHGPVLVQPNTLKSLLLTAAIRA